MNPDTPTRGKAGRKPALNAQPIEILREIVGEQPHASVDEVLRVLRGRTGTGVCSATVRAALRQAGITRLKLVRQVGERAASPGGEPLRVGYTDAHRREDGPSGMNTDLTDAEWVLVADLFERQGGRGTPPKYARKQMVDACIYIVRTGCAWRLLPKSFPPWHGAFTRPLVVGRRRASSKLCTIDCVRCGATAWDVTRNPPPRSSMHKAREARRKAA